MRDIDVPAAFKRLTTPPATMIESGSGQEVLGVRMRVREGSRIVMFEQAGETKKRPWSESDPVSFQPERFCDDPPRFLSRIEGSARPTESMTTFAGVLPWQTGGGASSSVEARATERPRASRNKEMYFILFFECDRESVRPFKVQVIILGSDVGPDAIRSPYCQD